MHLGGIVCTGRHIVLYAAACSVKTCGGGRKSGKYDYEKKSVISSVLVGIKHRTTMSAETGWRVSRTIRSHSTCIPLTSHDYTKIARSAT